MQSNYYGVGLCNLSVWFREMLFLSCTLIECQTIVMIDGLNYVKRTINFNQRTDKCMYTHTRQNYTKNLFSTIFLPLFHFHRR